MQLLSLKAWRNSIQLGPPDRGKKKNQISSLLIGSCVLHTSTTYKNTANTLARHHLASSTPKESKVLTKKEHHPQEDKRRRRRRKRTGSDTPRERRFLFCYNHPKLDLLEAGGEKKRTTMSDMAKNDWGNNCRRLGCRKAQPEEQSRTAGSLENHGRTAERAQDTAAWVEGPHGRIADTPDTARRTSQKNC